MTYTRIQHADELSRYEPPGHAGTVNVRLVDQDFCGAFEMICGVVQPGGEAERHSHETEHQIIYLVRGTADVSLGDEAPVRCQAGSIVRIPPGLDHRVVCVGSEPLETIVIYSPPLSAH